MNFISIPDLYELFKKHSKVCTDTRSIEAGSLFFALKGENFNGNKFAQQAIEAGAAFSIIDEIEYKKSDKCLLVRNVLEALQQLAHHHRKQLQIPIIAITGTNGKTTTKELINVVLSQKHKVLATKGNLNNHIGVPLTLLSINNTHEMAIVEMGANHQKEIEFLCNIALPDFGMITNIGKAHLEGFGGEEGVKKAKNEMYVFIKANNRKLFVNNDDALLKQLSEGITRITYGNDKSSNLFGKTIASEHFLNFEFSSNDGVATLVRTKLVGAYNLPNLLAAACVGNYFGVTNDKIKQGLENYSPTNSRSQIVKKDSNTLLLDAYNANPSSMEAAILNFSKLDAENKIVVLGDMLELGNQTLTEHQHIINLLKQEELTDTILVGKYFSQVENTINAKLFDTSEEARNFLKELNIKNSTVLIKGSRGTKMEIVTEAFND